MSESSTGAPLVGRIGWLQTRLRIPAIICLGVLAIFTCQRGLLAWSVREAFAGASTEALVHVFLTGLRYDLVIGCMAIVPTMVVLFTVPTAWLGRGWFRCLLAGYGAVVLAVLTFLSVADYFYFKQFEQRLNDNVLHYLFKSGNDYLLHIVVKEYPLVWALLGTALVLVGAFFGLRRFGFDRQYDRGPLWHGIWPILSMPLVFLAIRGTVSSHAINSGLAYRGGPPAVSQLTLNGAFTLRQAILASLYKEAAPGESFPLPSPTDALHVVGELVFQPTDERVPDPANPLHRVTHTGRPRRDLNVVMIVLESIHWPYIGAMGAEEDLMPNLSALMQQSVVMDHCYGVGDRTERGMSALASSFPDLLGASVTIRPGSIDRFLTIGHILHDRGYHTMFINGGPPHRDHRAVFLDSNGFDYVYGNADMRYRTFRTKLGWCDDDVFRTAHDMFNEEHAAGRPFCAMILTMSNHRPYEIPRGTVAPTPTDTPHAQKIDAMRYTDWALGRYMEQARQSDYFDRTLFVITADHMGGHLEHPHTPDNYRLPFAIYAPGQLDEPVRRVQTVCSQMDVAPTILSLLGGSYEHCFFGSSVLDRPDDRGFAFGQSSSVLYFMDHRRRAIMVPPHRGAWQLFSLTPAGALEPLSLEAHRSTADALQRNALAMLAAAHALYECQRYNLSGRPCREDAPVVAVAERSGGAE